MEWSFRTLEEVFSWDSETIAMLMTKNSTNNKQICLTRLKGRSNSETIGNGLKLYALFVRGSSKTHTLFSGSFPCCQYRVIRSNKQCWRISLDKLFFSRNDDYLTKVMEDRQSNNAVLRSFNDQKMCACVFFFFTFH